MKKGADLQLLDGFQSLESSGLHFRGRFSEFGHSCQESSQKSIGLAHPIRRDFRHGPRAIISCLGSCRCHIRQYLTTISTLALHHLHFGPDALQYFTLFIGITLDFLCNHASSASSIESVALCLNRDKFVCIHQTKQSTIRLTFLQVICLADDNKNQFLTIVNQFTQRLFLYLPLTLISYRRSSYAHGC